MSSDESILSEKGQITIPKEIRDRLGLAPGQVLKFETRKGQLIAHKQNPHDPLGEVVGLLQGKIDDVDAALTAMRDPNDQQR